MAVVSEQDFDLFRTMFGGRLKLNSPALQTFRKLATEKPLDRPLCITLQLLFDTKRQCWLAYANLKRPSDTNIHHWKSIRNARRASELLRRDVLTVHAGQFLGTTLRISDSAPKRRAAIAKAESTP